MQTTYVVIFVIYCILVFGIGLWAKKGTTSLEQHLVAGRNLGVLATGMAYYSTAQSSSAFLGMVGWAYAMGWCTSNYVSIPIAIGAILVWGLLANRVRKITGTIKGMTIPDLLEWRFPMKGIRLVAFFIIITAYIPMMTAQIKGCGILVQSVFTSISFPQACLVGLTIVTIYVLLGGMKAIAYTDVVQGIFMIVSVVVLTLASLAAVGGFTSMNMQATAIDPGFTSITGVGGTWTFMFSLSFVLLFLLAPLGAPTYITKFFAMKDLNVARFAMPLSYTCVFIASLAFPIIGICCKVLFPNLENADTAFTVMATSVLPPIIGAIVLVALFAAVMSTIDAMLLTITGAFVRDFYQQILKRNPEQKILLQISTASTIVISVIGLVCAIYSPSAIMLLGSASTGLLGASFIVVMVGGIYAKKINAQGALAAMITGYVVDVLCYPGIVISDYLLGMDPFIWGLLASIIAAAVVTKATKKTGIEATELAA